MELDNLRFGKQFFITPKEYVQSYFNDWGKINILDSKSLHTHPNLDVTTASTKNINLICLGCIIDPYTPQLNNTQILEKIINKLTDFSILEDKLERLGGRWVLIASINKKTRIYHDAAGLKPIFYSDNNGFYVASQPALLEQINATTFNQTLKKDFDRYTNPGSWPVNVIPYYNVKQILPNHYLDLDNQESIRYWPKKDIHLVPIRDAAESMNRILTGMIKALISRRESVMSLTGGYDTRLLLSSANNVLNKIEFFTIETALTPNHDISIPKKLAKAKRLKYKLITNNPDYTLVEMLSNNVGGMFYDSSMPKIKSFSEYVGDRLYLPGLVSEINRCYYYPDGISPKKMTVQELSHRAKFKENPIAEHGIKVWLNDVPKINNLNLLDLFYWENRLGVWASCGLTFKESLIDQIPPMNCREFLSLGLSTKIKYRKAPYALIREIINFNDSSLLKLKFNYDFKSEFLKKLPIPWRIKKHFGWVS